ncbi:MAG: class I SAM-dependent methyltransferase [Halanaerobiales bacterium]|nr:class I SAM-dependent methyltransferase [Halanaerobiales bacterium]
MSKVFRQTQLYKFLMYCNNSKLEKEVLDCGAGGNCPPLALFAEHGYKTYGIEIRDLQLEKANTFAKENGFDLSISDGDMRTLPFEDNSISFIFSYNTIFHLSKVDIAKAISEIKRVLRPGGLCFVNFLSTNDFRYGDGEKVGEGEYLHIEGGCPALHTYYEVDEAEFLFDDMEILFKENRVLERIFNDEKIRQGYIDYIAQKK